MSETNAFDTSRAPVIDLSLLPPPDVVESLDFERILAARKVRFLSLYPEERRAEMAATLELESEPIVILLEESAYCDMLLRQRVNEAARQCQLVSATGTNLEHLAALYSVSRLIVDAGDLDAIPPVPPTYETDARLRYRTQLAVEGMSTAGPRESYRFHSLSAHGGVADVSVVSPTPGRVVVTVLARGGDGTPSPEILDAVKEHLSGKTVRPLTDEVIVQAASIVNYEIEAELTLYPGPSPGPILDVVRAAAEAYAESTRRVGYDATRSGLYHALHQVGVQNVRMISPVEDVVIDSYSAAHCAAITLTLAGATNV